MDIYIKNLHPNLEENELRVLFEPFGEVISSTIVRDKDSGLSRGFGFVRMANSIDAQRAIDDMNGRMLGGKYLGVSEAIPRDDKRNPMAAREAINYENRPMTRTQTTIGEDGWASVKFEKNEEEEEEIPIDVVDKAEFTKTMSEDGLVKISFKSEDD